jgi:dihydrofolate reductase
VAKLIYTTLASLDGYVADRDGSFDWAVPDEEVHSFVNDLARPIGTYLYGRRTYDVLKAWETDEILVDQPPYLWDFAEIWRAAEKVVYSRSLDAVSTERTRLEREFDPETIRRLKAAAEGDIEVGGPELAAQALAAGLVDECHLLLSPVAVGGGKPALPVQRQLGLSLLEERRFGNGVVYLRYAVDGRS